MILCELAITTCCITVALNVMLRCRKLPFSIRYLSVMFLIVFLTMTGINIIFSVIRLIPGPNYCYYKLIFDSRSFFVSMFLLVLWCSMCVLTVERFIAIVFPYHYIQNVTKSTLYVTISLTWVFNIIVPSVIVFVSWLKVCGQYDYISRCDIFAVFKPFRIFTTFILCISYATTIVIYSKILFSIRKQARQILALNVKNTLPAEKYEQNASTQTPLPSISMILIIILSFIVLQSPYLFTFIIFEIRQDLKQQKWRVIFQIICYICHELDTFVPVYLYIWRFPECRLHFYHMFSKINNRYRQKAEALRMESKKISNDQELIQSDPISCPQNQKGNN